MQLMLALGVFLLTFGAPITPKVNTHLADGTSEKQEVTFRDTIPNPWEQYEYIEVKKENEDFDKPFGRRQNTEVIRRRKQVQAPRTGVSDYEGERSVGRSSGIPKIISIEPVASSDQLPPVETVREDYSGFKIEILSTPEALQPDNELFFRHGNVQVHNLASGSFSYLLGAFQSEENAQDFYDEYLGERYPEGKVIQYEKGSTIE